MSGYAGPVVPGRHHDGLLDLEVEVRLIALGDRALPTFDTLCHATRDTLPRSPLHP
jgi:hypothetical protein